MNGHTAESAREKLLAYSQDDQARDGLKSLAGAVDAALDSLVSRFYDALLTWPEARVRLEDEGLVLRMREARREHWAQLLTGRMSSEALSEFLANGAGIEPSGIPPHCYVLAYAKAMQDLAHLPVRGGFFTRLVGDKRHQHHMETLQQAMLLDMELTMLAIEEAEGEAVSLRRQILDLATELDVEVQSSVSRISGNAEQMQGIAENMRMAAERVYDQARVVATSADDANGKVTAVAETASGLARNSSNIHDRVKESTQIARGAVDEARRAGSMVDSLNDAVVEITKVVELISGIADQTNLLALNATIEAARAGEAGKGFAVVAGEVKHLANQTRQATDQVGDQARSIQEATGNAVEAIQGIDAVIGRMDEIARLVSEAVESRSGAITGISDSARSAEENTREVSSNIAQVSEEASETSRLAGDVARIAGEVATDMEAMRDRMTGILRHATAGDRRQHPRVFGDITVRMRVGNDRIIECLMVDISKGGARLAVRDPAPVGTAITLLVDQAGLELNGKILRLRPQDSIVEFILNGETRARLEQWMANLGEPELL